MAESQTPDRVRVHAQVLDRRLVAIAEGRQPLVPFAAAFLIYFREGIEAALLVAALLAGLRRLGRPDAIRYIHYGWLAALPAGDRHLVAVRPRDRRSAPTSASCSKRESPWRRPRSSSP